MEKKTKNVLRIVGEYEPCFEFKIARVKDVWLRKVQIKVIQKELLNN